METLEKIARDVVGEYQRVSEILTQEERKHLDYIRAGVNVGTSVDVTPLSVHTGRFSQDKFKVLYDFVMHNAKQYRKDHNRRNLAIIVSPDVGTAFQCLNSSDFKSSNDSYNPDSTVYVIGSIGEDIIVYCDSFAVESYAMIFATDSTALDNSTILDENLFNMQGGSLYIKVTGINGCVNPEGVESWRTDCVMQPS